jgi:hypothetical protein
MDLVKASRRFEGVNEDIAFDAVPGIRNIEIALPGSQFANHTDGFRDTFISADMNFVGIRFLGNNARIRRGMGKQQLGEAIMICRYFRMILEELADKGRRRLGVADMEHIRLGMRNHGIKQFFIDFSTRIIVSGSRLDQTVAKAG